MTANCPLCKSATTKMRALFVKHVLANEENALAYQDGTLTFDSYLKEYRDAMDDES
jgi:hypothetical protein